MKNKVIAIFLLLCIMVMSGTQVVKANILDDMFSSGGNFFNMGKATDDKFADDVQDKIFSDDGLGLTSLLQTAGNLIIIVAAVALGIKYIFSGIEGKSIVKETLPTFVVGVIFFYLAGNLVGFAGNIGNTIQGTDSSTALFGNVWSTVIVVANILTILGIILVGLRYMLVPVDKKADIKGQSLMIVLGLILIASAVPLLKFIVDVGESTIGPSYQIERRVDLVPGGDTNAPAGGTLQ